MKSLAIDGPLPKYYRLSGARAICELSTQTVPIVYTRLGWVEYQDTPDGLNFCTSLSWRWYKSQAGYTPCVGGVYRVQSEHVWWGLAVFETIRRYVREDGWIVINETSDLYSLSCVRCGRLVTYDTYNDLPSLVERLATLGLGECRVCVTPEQHRVLEQELKGCSLMPLTLRTGQCSSFEEFVAWQVLSQRSVLRKGLVACVVLGLLCLDVGRLVLDYRALASEAELLQIQVDGLKKHPLYAKDLPAGCPYHKFLPQLVGRHEWIQLSGQTIRLRTSAPLRSARLLRKLGFAIARAPSIDLLGVGDVYLEGCWSKPSNA